MATRSAVGYFLPSGKVKAAYVHWDGSPSTRLPLLNEHFPTLEDVVALVKPGSMSSIMTREVWNSGSYLKEEDGTPLYDEQGFLRYENDRDPQPLYHHERGNDGPWNGGPCDYGDPPQVNASLSAAERWWRDNRDAEYLYVFDPGIGKWFYYDLID